MLKPLTWDEAKRRSNLKKHGLDFAHVADFDVESGKTVADTRGLTNPKFVYPEPRFISIGLMRGKLVVLVYSERERLARHQSQASRWEGTRGMARKMTRADDDAPPITAALFAKMRPMKEVTPGMVDAIKTARRGRPKVEEPKVVFTMRVSQKAHKGWATLASDKRKKLAAAFERSIFETAGVGAKARPTTGQRHR